MKTTQSLKDKLSIIIPTYNRDSCLERTLNELLNSPVNECSITILDNHSTDNTYTICKKFISLFTNLHIVRQPTNLGGGCENYIHAINYCKTEYMWILADDDKYNFSIFEDVKQIILEAQYDIIQVGAHNDKDWNWGVSATPKELIKMGYPYFKYSSFLPCSIFRYKYFLQFIKEAYHAISFRYPHFPCLINAYVNNIKIYISKNRIVTAVWGKQTYNDYIPIRGFLFASTYLQTKKEKRIMLLTLSKKHTMSYLTAKYIYHFLYPINMERIAVLYGLFSLLNIIEFITIILAFIPLSIAYLLKKQ